MSTLTLTFDGQVDPDTRATIRQLLAGWDQALFNDGQVRLHPLLGGANNRNFVVESGGAKYALRVANDLAERLAVDRASALQAQQDAAAADVAPTVLAWRLPEGHQLAEFQEGTVLSADNLHDAEVLRAVGRCLAKLHGTPTKARSFSPFDDIRIWITLAAQDGVPLSPELRELVEVTDRIRALVDSLPLAPVFCHNDTVPQNFIAADSVRLVDWDYAGRGLAAFELGSFACTADLSPAEIDELMRGYGTELSPAAMARIGLMGFVAAVREVAWATMAAPILSGSTGVGDDWYAAYLETNSERARELRSRHCEPALFDTAARCQPGTVI